MRILRFALAAALALGLLNGSVIDSGFSVLGPAPFRYPITDQPSQPLEPLAEKLGIPWPPARLRLLALKEEKVLEIWIADAEGAFERLITYAITAASGGAGPKRKEGDLQVPEGFYRLTDLNPNSRFHLSIRVDYPNATDLAHSALRRSEMGGDIMVHGNAVSIGCIAIGDEAIERVYDLISKVPRGNREIWIAPVDFRRWPTYRIDGEEAWVDRLYEELVEKVAKLPL